jgi:hypothetical protein
MRFLAILSCAVVTLALAARAEAALIYASTAAGAAGHLYTINSATGAMVQDIGPLNDGTGQNYPITGLAFHPTTGLLYGSSGNSQSATEARLVIVNPLTALVTPIGSFNAGPTNAQGVPSTMADIAFDAAGNLFGVASIGGPNLYSINPATGQATAIGTSGLASTSGGALAINSSGTIFGSPSASRFGTYNGTTGAFTNIADPVEPAGGGAWGALDFDENGVLYGLNVGAGSPPPTHLATFNPTTGVVTDIGASLNSLDAIAIRVPEPTSAGAVAMLVGVAAMRRRTRRGS